MFPSTALRVGRCATDASSYQVMLAGAVAPRTSEAASAALALAEERVPVTFRGGGTSQCGQTVNEGLIVDTSKYLNRFFSLDVAAHGCIVEPGIVLDDLNQQLAPHSLWFPVDVSTAIEIKLSPVIPNRALDVAHFGSFYKATDSGAAHRAAEAYRRRARRCNDDCAWPRHRDVPAAYRAGRQR